MSGFLTPVNLCNFIGNLGADPELRYTPSGTALAKFSLAVSERVRDSSGEYRDETMWLNLIVWGKQAELVSTQLSKGDTVAVTTKLQVRAYETDDGEKRKAHEFTVLAFRRLTKRNGGSNGSAEHVEEEETEDIPF